MNVPSGPLFSPQLCFEQTALRDFLRISRGIVDDCIIQNLNALETPSRDAWSSQSHKTLSRSSLDARASEDQACSTFQHNILFPSWQKRSEILNYCARVALDPEDPDLILKQVETAKERERVVDERLDPYSGRFFPREARTEILANLIRNEKSVESIIRSRSWRIVQERCGNGLMNGDNWEAAFDAWKARRNSS